MARSGVYFSDVKRARDGLVAQGRRPSIDAVRAALGDTGSKTTIHKYLREIEAEEGVPGLSVSDEIGKLVAQLASQLKQEAQVELDALRLDMATARAAQDATDAAASQKSAQVDEALRQTATQLAASEAAVAALHADLAAQHDATREAGRRADVLAQRLGDAERHQASLEEKHQHARDALAHFRQAAKEQREQELRRHEQQVQALQVELRQVQQTSAARQEELARINKEAAALVAELAAGKHASYLERESNRNLARKVDQLQAAEADHAVVKAQLLDSRKRIKELEQAAVHAAVHDQAQREALAAQAARLEAELASAQATIQATIQAAAGNAALEERLARLDQAVFGQATVVPETGSETAGKPA